MNDNSFTFEYAPGAIHHGSGVVGELSEVLASHGCARALVVTDANLAEVDVVMDPVLEGLGSHHVATCDAVTPAKYLAAAYEGAQLVADHDVDALVPVGGGSSLDVAKLIAVLDGHDEPLDEIAQEMVDREAAITPDAEVDLLDIFAVPTTLPGADLSQVAGVNLSLDPAGTSKAEIPSDGVSDRRLMPTAVFHDLELFATTPAPILARSAMNGYDKGIEMLYTRHHTPITDGIAMRGVRLLQEHLPALLADDRTDDDLSQILRGIAAAQYGLSTPQHYRASLIHSFGHAIARNYDVQQGVAHAIAAPHALRYMFEEVHGRREILAEALGVYDDDASDEELAERIVDAIAATRDALDLPDRLRDIEGPGRSVFPRLAEAVIEDPFMEAGPRDLEATQSDIEAVFDAMW